jgi:hypothetical protein
MPSEPMRSSDATRFLLRLACFAPLAGLVLLVNWVFAQPPVRRLFTGTLDAAAEALVAGKSIRSQIDMADIKPIWIEHLRTSPDVVVLGSSRMVQIRQDWFGPRVLWNLAMPGGDFADAVAIFQQCLETGKHPGLVLLELNPTLTFDEKSHVAPALAPHFRRALLRYGIFPPVFFSGPLTLDALRWDPRLFARRRPWEISDTLEPTTYRLHPDGSAEWLATESGVAPDAVEQAAISEMHRLDPEHRRWRTSSQPRWFDRRILLALLDDLRARGIRVVVVLAPVHPAAFDFYFRQGGYDDTWIRRDMASRGVTVIGSYSPAVARVTRADFFDDVHVQREVLHRLLREGKIVD